MPMISVIVPIYNTEQFLPVCLDSLLTQTTKDIEIIAVDNGSTDGCLEILESYAVKDQRINVVAKPHGDIYTARNAGLQTALGEWIAFCDSDDTLPSKAYLNMLKKTKRASCDVVVGGYVEMDKKTGSLPASLPHKNGNDFQVLMQTPCIWNKLIRREFILETDLQFTAVFLAQLLRCKPKIETVNRPVYYYWQHYSGDAVSLSYRYTCENFRGLIQAHRMVCEELRDTRYRLDAEKYVYFSLALTLKEFLPRIWDTNERQICFELFRNHILDFTWIGQEDIFSQLFGVSFSKFLSMTAEEYLRQIMALSHRKATLVEYHAGVIGFQYIIAYFNAWLGYKTKKTRSEKMK